MICNDCGIDWYGPFHRCPGNNMREVYAESVPAPEEIHNQEVLQRPLEADVSEPPNVNVETV